MALQENRRHKRLCHRAARLDVADLLEIAAMKGLRARDVRAEPDSGEDSAGDEAEPAAAHASGSSGSACSGVMKDNDAVLASEAEPPATTAADAVAEAASVDKLPAVGDIAGEL